jgi:hypothetical protein
MTTKGQMNPTSRVSVTASQAEENSQTNGREHTIVSIILEILVDSGLGWIYWKQWKVAYTRMESGICQNGKWYIPEWKAAYAKWKVVYTRVENSIYQSGVSQIELYLCVPCMIDIAWSTLMQVHAAEAELRHKAFPAECLDESFCISMC